MDWEDRFRYNHPRCLSTDCSDHTPFLLNTNLKSTYKREAIRPKYLGFLEAVVATWELTRSDCYAFRTLDIKLCNTAKALQSWSQQFVGSICLQLAIAKEVVLRLEMIQDHQKNKSCAKNSSANHLASPP